MNVGAEKNKKTEECQKKRKDGAGYAVLPLFLDVFSPSSHQNDAATAGWR